MYLQTLNCFLPQSLASFENRGCATFERHTVPSVVLIFGDETLPEADSFLWKVDDGHFFQLAEPHSDCRVFRGKGVVVCFWAHKNTGRFIFWPGPFLHWRRTSNKFRTYAGLLFETWQFFYGCWLSERVGERGRMDQLIDKVLDRALFLSSLTLVHIFISLNNYKNRRSQQPTSDLLHLYFYLIFSCFY